MKRAILCCFALLLLLNSSGSAQSIVDGHGNRVARLRYAATTRLDFRNAEVLIKRTSVTAPCDPAFVELTERTELLAHALVDYEIQRCFWLQSRRKGIGTGQLGEPNYSYTSYRDGAGTRFPREMRPAKPGYEGFFEYLGTSNVCRVEQFAILGPGVISTKTPEGLLTEKLIAIRELSSRSADDKLTTEMKSDGFKHFISEAADGTARTVEVYDPRFIFPIRITNTKRTDGKDEVQLEHIAVFEHEGDFTRALSSKLEVATTLTDATGADVPAICTESVELKWIQFNTAQLRWPNESQITINDGSMIRFLNPEK